MSKVLFDDILGVFTNGDPDNISKTQVDTHGSGDTGKFTNLDETLDEFTITNVYTFSNSNLKGNDFRTLVVKVNNATQNIVFEINDGF